MAAAALSPALSRPRSSLISPPLPPPSLSPHQNLIFPSPSPISSSSSSPSCLCQAKQSLHLAPIDHRRRRRSWKSLQASPSESSVSVMSSERWLLEPVGDGDSRHIGYKVPLPDAFEIASDAVTVGRLPEKADFVIPVATVSGLHARLEKKKNGTLLVTDMNSTNGTFVDDKKLKPGVATTVSPGNCVTFGDTNLAMFRVSKIEIMDVAGKETEGSETKSEAEVL